MLILLYGEDTFRSRQKLNEIIAHYKARHAAALSFQRIDCTAPESSNVQGMLQTNSLFGEKKLLVLENAFGNEKLLETLQKQERLLQSLTDVMVFFQEGAIAKTHAFFKFLLEYAKAQEFSFLSPAQVKKWVAQAFEAYHTKAEPRAIEILASSIGNDLWRMAQEIKKLVAKARSSQGIVVEKDVENLESKNLEADIFATLHSIAKKDKRSALEQLAKHLKRGESPLYLLSMLAFEFRNLLLIRDLIDKHVPLELMAKRSRLHPFVVKKSLEVARNFSFAGLKSVYQKIFELDLSIKKGLLEPSLAISLFVSRL